MAYDGKIPVGCASYKAFILESGEPLVAAMGLYRNLGYQVIPNYGPYVDMQESVCMKKELDDRKKEETKMSNVIDVIKKRSSTRGYTSEPLTDAELDTLIHAGLQAPTAANKQEIHFTILKGDNPILGELEEEKNRLREIVNPLHNFYYEAPVVIILSADSEYKWSALDAGIAVENMALAAEELGLGNLIIGCIYDAIRGEKKEYFNSALQFPENYVYEIAIAFGHKAVTKEPHTYDADAQVTYL